MRVKLKNICNDPSPISQRSNCGRIDLNDKLFDKSPELRLYGCIVGLEPEYPTLAGACSGLLTTAVACTVRTAHTDGLAVAPRYRASCSMWLESKTHVNFTTFCSKTTLPIARPSPLYTKIRLRVRVLGVLKNTFRLRISKRFKVYGCSVVIEGRAELELNIRVEKYLFYMLRSTASNDSKYLGAEVRRIRINKVCHR
ncbi:hypothetical protein EVAR_45422_1 [Eumeta japonica]|uniref:Uncharacterized protein n=1 Tax=Eumeta variegata TaxID=151549 RepID=A0A4C1ZKA7_EUMVA|nr:hypothetical protein EVAR_45422_1 [Eumeta japonica]